MTLQAGGLQRQTPEKSAVFIFTLPCALSVTRPSRPPLFFPPLWSSSLLLSLYTCAGTHTHIFPHFKCIVRDVKVPETYLISSLRVKKDSHC